MTTTPRLVVHHLNESRSQRVLWMLEELGLDYDLVLHFRDPVTRLGPPELKALHPLGKAPLLVDNGQVIAESGAILEHLVRLYGGGRLAPSAGSADYDAYQQWLHFAEGSAMLPLMLLLYSQRLGVAAAPIQPRIDAEIANHLSYIDVSLTGRDFLVGTDLTAADVQISTVLEIARAFGRLDAYANASRYLDALHARPGFRRSVERGGAYGLGR